MNNIKKSECGVLFKLKRDEGKDEDVAGWEIQRDIATIENLKIDVAQRKREIERLKNEKIKTDDKFKKKFEQLQKSQDKLAKPIKTNGKNTTTLVLKRIILCLEENKELGIKEIERWCCVNSELSRDGIHFLLKYHIIKERIEGRFSFYSLNNGLSNTTS